MESFVAVGLASNIVGFLDVASKFCTTVSQLYRDGRTSQDAECAIITGDLVKVCAHLTAEVIARSGTAGNSTGIDQRIDFLAARCTGLAQTLSTKLQALAVAPGSSRGVALTTALKRMWCRGEINNAVEQLRDYQQELSINILTDIRNLSSTNVHRSDLLRLESSISTVETRLSAIARDLEAGLLSVTTKLGRLEISHQNADAQIQALSRQEAANHGETMTELKEVASRNEIHNETIIRHLRVHSTELERVARSRDEQQFVHVSGNEESLTALVLANTDATATGPVFATFLRTAQASMKEFFAKHQHSSQTPNTKFTTHAEYQALEFVARNLSDCMTKESTNFHYATFSWAATVNYLGLGTVIIQVTNQQQLPRCQRPQSQKTSLRCSLNLITSPNILHRGLSFSYHYSVDPRGLPSLVSGIRLFNLLPQNDASFVHQHELGRSCSQETILVLMRYWSRVQDLYLGAEKCRCCYNDITIDGIIDTWSQEIVCIGSEENRSEHKPETNIELGKLPIEAPLIQVMFSHFPRHYTPFDRDEDGHTILHFAADGLPDEAYISCAFLVNLGADKEACSRYGEIPFHRALRRRVFDIRCPDPCCVSAKQLSCDSEKLLRLLWPGAFDSPDKTIEVLFDSLSGTSATQYTLWRPHIKQLLSFLAHLGGFPDWGHKFVVTWWSAFTICSPSGEPMEQDFLVKFLTDVFECFPPGGEILFALWRFIENVGKRKPFPGYLSGGCMPRDGDDGRWLQSHAPKSSNSEFVELPNTDGISCDKSCDFKIQFFVGITELARISIGSGIGIYLSCCRDSSLLDYFSMLGFGWMWCSLVEDVTGIPKLQYFKNCLAIRQACNRRAAELKQREAENARRREEHQTWSAQDKQREKENRRRLEEEVQWFTCPPTAAATNTLTSEFSGGIDYQRQVEAQERWTREDQRRVEEDRERMKTKARWMRENERRADEDRRRKAEEREWTYISGKKGQYCPCG